MRSKIILSGLAALFLLVSAAASAQINPFGRSGFALTPEDTELLGQASAKILDDPSAPIGRRETWSNAASGAQGSVELERRFTHQGLPCRRLQHDITIPGVSEGFRFIIDRCQIDTGEWKIL